MWVPSGHKVRSKVVGMTPSLKGRCGRPALPGVLKRPLDVLDRRRHLHRPGVMLLQVRPRIRDEVRELAEREVDLDDAAAALPVLDVADEVARQLVAGDVVQERRLRVKARDHHWREDLLALLEHGATDPAALDQQPLDLGVGANLGAEADRGPLDRLGDRAHPSLGEAPTAEVTVTDVADRMVRHDVGRSRLARPGPRADDAVHGHGGLDLRRLEPVVQQVGDAHRHEAGDVCDRSHVEPLVTPGQPEGLA